MKTESFIAAQRLAQGGYMQRSLERGVLLPGTPYRLEPGHRALNLFSAVREQAAAYFGPPRNIAWHRHADHGLSSQICCVNFLMPLATQPEALGEVIGRALGRPHIRMIPVEQGVDGEPWHVDFEWTGRQDYLSEWPKTGTATRGANVTSADAMVRFERDGRVETLLIEWKYTESYGTPPRESSKAERIRRYEHKAFHPDGPIRADLGLKVEDLFWEPFYQMFRQQMLAHRMSRAHEDGAERVSVLHISPRGNRALHKVTAPALKDMGADAFEVFRSILVRPEDFTSVAIEDVFGTTLEHHKAEPWAAYLRDRYSFLSPDRSSDAQETP